MRSFATIVVIALGYLFSAVEGSGQTAVVVGSSCVVVNQNVKATDGGIVVNQLECPESPENSFILRYVWLDRTASSLMLVSQFDEALKPLVGDVQTVIRNPVFDQVDTLVQKFGAPPVNVPGTGGMFDKGMRYNIMGKSDAEVQSAGTPMPLKKLKTFKLYDAETTILLPDVDGLREVLKTRGWPRNYRLTYSTENVNLNFKNKKPENENLAISCVLLHRPVPKSELENYWPAMENLERAMDAREFRPSEVISNEVGGTDFRVAAVQNRAIDAMLYFGEKSWPDDFLMSFGNAVSDQCGDGYSFGYFAPPRSLYTLVAVVEAKNNNIEVQQIRYLVDDETGLRKLRKGTRDDQSPVGVVNLKQGESLLIPLRIELRYDMEVWPMSALNLQPAAEDVRQKILEAPMSVLRFQGKDDPGDNKALARVVFEKLRSEFRPPESRDVTQAYVFGPSYAIANFDINGKTVVVRQAPSNAIAYLGDTGTGSCPFLYVDSTSGDWRKLGRILVAATNAAAPREEQVALPPGTRALVISEQEPEITHIEFVSVRDDETGQEFVLAEKLELHPGWSKELRLPDAIGDQATLRVKGYYQPLRPRPETVRFN